jgi:enoyl-CoA hydratase
LYEAFTLAALDREIARISLRAAGKAFSLGAELSEFGTTLDPATAHAIRARTLPALPAARCADRLDAHVQGACVGAGLELAAWARRLTATPRAWFQLPELAMGILPGAGGCVSLTRRLGRQRAALMILSGKRLSARQALDWGLIDAMVDEPA